MNLYQTLQQKPFLISGPCVIESQDLLMRIAERVKLIAEELDITYIFKASFDKANRTSVDAFRGPGLEEGLRMMEKVKKEFDLPLTTDIHEPNQAKPASEVIDILQIPAFLCRQTDLLLEAGKTNKIVNIKKAQFLTGADMIHPAKKVESTGNKQIMLTERGNSYGNNNLVVDFRNIVDMQQFGYPIIMDVTHSCQKPGGAGSSTAGNREYAPFFARGAASMGVRGFFFETHPNPSEAKSDGPNMIPLDEFKELLISVMRHVEGK